MLMLKLMPNKYSGNLKVLTFKAHVYFMIKKLHDTAIYLLNGSTYVYLCRSSCLTPLAGSAMSPFFSHRHFPKTFYFVTFLRIAGKESNLHAVGNLGLSASEIAPSGPNLFP